MSEDAKEKEHDVVLLHGRTEDGQGIRALRSRPGRVDLAELRMVKEGQPISGELVRLQPREESPLLWNVEVQLHPETEAQPRQPATTRSGPPCVASEAYRCNWEAIFGKKKPPRSDDPN